MSDSEDDCDNDIKLCKLIQPLKELYQDKHPKRKNSHHMKTQWACVIQGMGKSPKNDEHKKEVKNQWKRMYSRMKIEVGVMLQEGLTVETYESPWGVYEHLKYLIPSIMSVRETTNPRSTGTYTNAVVTKRTTSTEKEAHTIQSVHVPSQVKQLSGETIESSVNLFLYSLVKHAQYIPESSVLPCQIKLMEAVNKYKKVDNVFAASVGCSSRMKKSKVDNYCEIVDCDLSGSSKLKQYSERSVTKKEEVAYKMQIKVDKNYNDEQIYQQPYDAPAAVVSSRPRFSSENISPFAPFMPYAPMPLVSANGLYMPHPYGGSNQDYPRMPPPPHPQGAQYTSEPNPHHAYANQAAVQQQQHATASNATGQMPPVNDGVMLHPDFHQRAYGSVNQPPLQQHQETITNTALDLTRQGPPASDTSLQNKNQIANGNKSPLQQQQQARASMVPGAPQISVCPPERLNGLINQGEINKDFQEPGPAAGNS